MTTSSDSESELFSVTFSIIGILTRPTTIPTEKSNVSRSKIAIDYSQKVARITAAIFLQSGLIDGTIPADPLISELLHFGSITPDQIIKLDTDKVKNSIGTLKGLSEKLEDAKQNEDFLEALIQTKKLVEGVPDVLKWTDTEEAAQLTTHLQGIQAMKFDWAGQLSAEVNGFMIKYNPVKNEDMRTAVWAKDLQFRFNGMISSLSRIISLAGPFPTDASQNLKEDDINGMNDVLSNVFKVMDAMKLCKPLSNDDDSQKKNVANMKAIQDTSGNLNDVLVSIETVTSLISPSGSSSKPLNYSIGFQRGLLDFSIFLTDLESKWVKQIIGSDKFPLSLDKLKSIVPVSKSIEKNFGVSDKKTIQSLELVYRIASEVVSSGSAKQATEDAKKLSACPRPADYPSIDDIQILRSHVNAIGTSMDEMKKGVVEVVSQLTSRDAVKWFKDIRKICSKATSDDKQLMNDTWNEFMKYPHLAQFENTMNDVDKKLKAIQSQKMTSSATEALSVINNVKLFNDDPMIENFMNFINCLNGLSDPKPIVDLMALSKELRGLQGNSAFDESIEVGNYLQKFFPDLLKLRKVLAEMKHKETNATAELKRFKNQQKHATVIGKSSMAISSMKDVLEKKSAVEKVLPHLTLLKTLKTGSKLAQKDWITLDTLATLTAPLQKMFDEIQKWSSSLLSEVKDLDTIKLTDLSEIFEMAKAVSGVAMDFLKMTAAVDRLIKETGGISEKQKLQELREQLQYLSDLEVDFRRFRKSFAYAPGSLYDLQSFFKNLRRQPEVTVRPKKEEGFPTWIWLIVGLVGFLLSLAVVAYFLLRKKKPETNK